MSQNDSILSPSLSEEYTDLIYRYQEPSGQTLAQLAAYSPQPVNSQYVILHIPSPEGLSNVSASGYASVPKLFTFLNTAGLEESGILTALSQPVLGLTGQGILVGFLDSGIDYGFWASGTRPSRPEPLRGSLGTGRNIPNPS